MSQIRQSGTRIIIWIDKAGVRRSWHLLFICNPRKFKEFLENFRISLGCSSKLNGHTVHYWEKVSYVFNPLWKRYIRDYEQQLNKLYPSTKQRTIRHIAINPFVIKSMIVIPIAIQNSMKPIILFIYSLPIQLDFYNYMQC